MACEDAGGAAALAPVLAALLARGDSLSFFVGPVAAKTFGQRGLAIGDGLLASDAEVEARVRAEAFANASALLTATTCWGLRLEARAVLAARAAGCPSCGVLDFWSNYEARLSYPGATGWDALPDRLAIIDATMRRDLEDLGADASRLVVTGTPALDAVVARPRAWGGAAGVVLFLSQPIEALYGDSLGYTEKSVLRALAAAVSAGGAELVVRPHPREDVAALDAYLRSLACRARIASEGDLASAIARASVVVGMTTFALIEAALLGAPVISAQIGRRGPDALPTNRMALTRGVTDEAELQATVLAALSSPASLLDAARAAAAHFEPNAASRVLAVLDALIDTRGAR